MCGQKAQYYFYNLFTAADKNLRVNKSILTLLLAAIIGSWHSARAQTEVIIGADPMIHYEHVVAAMDAVRSDQKQSLFPKVLLSAGIR